MTSLGGPIHSLENHLLQALISTPPSPEVEKFSNENFLPRRGSKPGPAEPEADMLPSEPERRAVYGNIKI